MNITSMVLGWWVIRHTSISIDFGYYYESISSYWLGLGALQVLALFLFVNLQLSIAIEFIVLMLVEGCNSYLDGIYYGARPGLTWKRGLLISMAINGPAILF